MRFNFKLRNSICYLSLGHIRSLVRLDLAGVMSCRTCVVFVVIVVAAVDAAAVVVVAGHQLEQILFSDSFLKQLKRIFGVIDAILIRPTG